VFNNIFAELARKGGKPSLLMIGNAEILKAALARGLGHCLQRLGAVRRVGVAAQNTAKVA
jgi:hypothetical protein